VCVYERTHTTTIVVLRNIINVVKRCVANHIILLHNTAHACLMNYWSGLIADGTVDGGYGWVVVAAVFAVHFFVLGTIYTFGFFYSEFLDAFQNSTGGEIAWIGSIAAGTFVGIAGFTGPLADRYGNGVCVCWGGIVIFISLFLASFSEQIWHLYITQGLLCGCGYSMAFVAGISVIGQWFDQKRGLAVGIAVSGSGVGQFGMAPITSYLLHTVGWRMTLRYLATISSIGLIICGLVIKRRLPLVSRSADIDKNQKSALSNLHDRFKDRNFSLIYLSNFFTSLGYMMPFTHIVKYADMVGVSASKGVFIVSLVGICSAVGRATLGQFADKFNRLYTFRICLLMGGFTTLFWVVCTDFASLVVYAVLFGYFAGGFISLMPVVCSELFKGQEMGELMGLVYTASTVGNMFSGPIGGFLFDVTGTYTLSITVAGLCMVTGGICALALRRNVPSSSVMELPSVANMNKEACGGDNSSSISILTGGAGIIATEEELLDENPDDSESLLNAHTISSCSDTV
jgi:MFS family permease